jgi:RepB DNA-primase from phage plasmid
VAGFGKEQAELLQRGLARQVGADPAATDYSRVLRLPGFYNHKYDRPHRVRVESLAGVTYRPEQFPGISSENRDPYRGNASQKRRAGSKGVGLSQSERDWAFAKRALARGESPALVAAAIAVHRRFEKHNPQYYAELTVKKAAESLSPEATRPLDRQCHLYRCSPKLTADLEVRDARLSQASGNAPCLRM